MNDASEPHVPHVRTADEPTTSGMGVSSERVGPTGPGQVGRTGLRDTTRLRTPDAPAPVQARPEQSSGGVEVNPDPITLPKAGFPKQHPRSKERPFYRRG